MWRRAKMPIKMWIKIAKRHCGKKLVEI